MQVFTLIDEAMLAQESREAYYSRTPRVWPSEASAELFDKREAGIAGGCHRKSYFRMTGEPPTNQIDVERPCRSIWRRSQSVRHPLARRRLWPARGQPPHRRS